MGAVEEVKVYFDDPKVLKSIRVLHNELMD